MQRIEIQIDVALASRLARQSSSASRRTELQRRQADVMMAVDEAGQRYAPASPTSRPHDLRGERRKGRCRRSRRRAEHRAVLDDVGVVASVTLQMT
jgi:hypothetical protein